MMHTLPKEKRPAAGTVRLKLAAWYAKLQLKVLHRTLVGERSKKGARIYHRKLVSKPMSAGQGSKKFDRKQLKKREPGCNYASALEM